MRHSVLSASTLLLLASTFSNAAPILSQSKSQSPRDCAYGTCSERIRLTGSPSHVETATRPHDILRIEIEITERVRKIDNSIFSPSEDVPPSRALLAHRPLSTTYLQSITKATQSLEQKVANYLSSHPASLSKPTDAVRTTTKKPCKKEWTVYLPGNVYIKTHKYVSRKPDAAVVGIVLVFLSLVVLAECIDRCVQCLKEKRAQRMGRGEIYLEEKDGEVRIIGEGISIISWEDEKRALVHEVEI